MGDGLEVMNKLIRLSPTGIEYGDYVWNFASGCGNNIDGRCRSGDFKCWAYSITQRFEGHYPNGFMPAIYPEALYSPLYLKKPSRILCAFMGDLFGDGFSPTTMVASRNSPYGKDLKTKVYDTIRACPQHRFLFLTKQPQNLLQWSPFPDNCGVGQTLTNQDDADRTFNDFAKVEATVKYVSLEPLLGRVDISPYLKGWVNAGTIFENPEGVERYDVDGALVNHIDWVIIGAQTSPKKLPEWEWVKEIINACDKANISVFLKDNLGLPRLSHDGATPFYKRHPSGTMELRQELPVER